MPREHWSLRRGRPCVEVVLTVAADGRPLSRSLLADSGAGSRFAHFHMILDEEDCLLCGGRPLHGISLRGAYAGAFPLYGISVRLPSLGFHKHLRAVGVPSVPPGFDGIACFSFLNGFTYGNFGNANQCGLEH
jgi:hypothetical protein